MALKSLKDGVCWFLNYLMTGSRQHFLKGCEIFANCNKEASIPHFTEHLKENPDDPEALLWRSRAYNIIGEIRNAERDLQRVIDVCTEKYKMLAEARLHLMRNNNEERKRILSLIISRFPDFPEARLDLAQVSEVGDAVQLLRSAIDIAVQNNEKKGLWFSLACIQLGDFAYAFVDIDNALRWYTMAIESCNGLTVAHLRISMCNISKGIFDEAKGSFQRAKELNPTLVKFDNFEKFKEEVILAIVLIKAFELAKSDDPSLGRWESFETFKDEVAINKNKTGKTTSSATNNSSSTKGGKKPNGKDKRGDNDDNRTIIDDDGKEVPIGDFFLGQIKKSNSRKKKHRGKDYYRTRCGNFWISRDTAQHGKSFLKVYEEKGTFLKFLGSASRLVFKVGKEGSDEEVKEVLKRDLELKDWDIIIKKNESGGDIFKTDMN